MVCSQVNKVLNLANAAEIDAVYACFEVADLIAVDAVEDELIPAPATNQRISASAAKLKRTLIGAALQCADEVTGLGVKIAEFQKTPIGRLDDDVRDTG